MNTSHVILDDVLICEIGSFHGLRIKGAGIAMVAARLYALIRLWVKSCGVESLALHISDLKFPFPLGSCMTKFAMPCTTLPESSQLLGPLVSKDKQLGA